jgi:hypothetical protein
VLATDAQETISLQAVVQQQWAPGAHRPKGDGGFMCTLARAVHECGSILCIIGGTVPALVILYCFFKPGAIFDVILEFIGSESKLAIFLIALGMIACLVVGIILINASSHYLAVNCHYQ